MTMLRDVIREHLEEAEVVVERRSDALRSEAWTLQTLSTLEERLEAHLEGVRIGRLGSPGLFERSYPPEDDAAAFVWAATRLGEPGQSAAESVLAAVASAGVQGRQGITEALGWTELSGATRSALLGWMSGRPGSQASVALDVLSFHRVAETRDLAGFLDAPEARTRAAAARAAGRLGRRAHGRRLEQLSRDSNPSVREAALEAGVRLGLTWSRARLREIAGRDAEATPQTLQLLGSVGDRRDVSLLAQQLGSARLAEAAMAALATLGYVEAVPALIECMTREGVARGAGGSFRRITGLSAVPEAKKGSSQEEDDSDFHDLRPLPDRELASRTWRAAAARFHPDSRYRNGDPLSSEAWLLDPHRGDLLTRREELSRMWFGDPSRLATLEPDAPASRQRRLTAEEATP